MDGVVPSTPSQAATDASAPATGEPRMTPATKVAQHGLDKVRLAMGRSTRRLESLEAVLKTQIQDGMHSASIHVRAAIREEKDRLFKLSQTLVKQELKLREAQSSARAF